VGRLLLVSLHAREPLRRAVLWILSCCVSCGSARRVSDAERRSLVSVVQAARIRAGLRCRRRCVLAVRVSLRRARRASIRTEFRLPHARRAILDPWTRRTRY
jgi:hypothetical protein